MDVKDLADRYQVTPLRMGIRLRELGLDGSATGAPTVPERTRQASLTPCLICVW